MGKDPAFLFYPGDWLGGTMGMNMEQKGCYIQLLMLQFNCGKFTEQQAKQELSICFDSAWLTIKHKFKTDGIYFWNERLLVEVEKRKSYIESRRFSGLTPKKKKAYAKHTHKRSEDINRNEDLNNNINVSFEIFWNLYDKKRGDKVKLESKWISFTDQERQQIIDYIPKYKLSQPDKKYRKDPQTFFNNHSWNDEIIISHENNSGNNQRGIKRVNDLWK